MRPSEVAAGVGVVCLLLALLTWLLVRGIATDAAVYSTTLRILNDFALAEASLDRDVLQARAGLLTDYDPLVRSSDEIDAAVSQLRAQGAAEGLDEGPVDRLAGAVKIEETLTERFKSDDALLRNSLSYVTLLSASPGFHDRDLRLRTLATAVLQLALDSSARSQQAVEEGILDLAVHPPVEADQGTAEALASHARLLKILLPSVDDTLRGLLAVQTGQPLEETRALFARSHAASESSAQRFRLLLYATSVLLALALIDIGRRLRGRVTALRKQAAFEHLIAEQSARLIRCPPAETKTRVEQALSEFGRMVGAERAYAVLGENPLQIYSWSEDNVPYPPGWPEAAFSLPSEFKQVGLNIITAPDVALLPPSDGKKMFLAVGIFAWACVVLQRPSYRGVLGFDKLRPGRGLYLPLATTRLAGDVIADALEREIQESERAKLNARLERALRMQMVGQLASGVAHNFNNIISAILGYSEMASSEVEPGGKAARRIAEIERAAERGQDLVDSILTFGRRPEARSSLVSITELLNETASLLRASLPSSVELVVADAPKELAVFGERAQLQQVIVNLCRNAAQAMEEAGRIDVSADAQHLRAARVFTGGELEPGAYVRIAVSDAGPGFGEDVAKRLFEPFFTTRPAGTGLGLATVRKIVRDHDGAVDVASAPGKGSRFEVWLPAAGTDVSATARGKPAAPPPLGQGETVAVVHDDRDSLLGDEEILAALGYEPIGFDRLVDAVAAIRGEPARFDAILICLASVGDALDLAQTLHAINPMLPILLARSALDIGVDALAQVGVVDLVRRPLVGAELASALARCLASAKISGAANNVAS
ncbi:MAG: two-component system VirA-like sensor kinase [Hyphomicrobiales bacterium]|nr:two-component system VirA-like sensor kinase [Hyphomicrobiales bacterium]